MMPSPEYERFSALKGEALEVELCRLGFGGYSREEYKGRLTLLNELAVKGQGPGAWFERFIHECQQMRGKRGS